MKNETKNDVVAVLQAIFVFLAIVAFTILSWYDAKRNNERDRLIEQHIKDGR